MSGVERGYDEARIRDRLEGLAVVDRVGFAAACAELVFPAYEWFVEVTGRGDAQALRSVLDAAWDIGEAKPVDHGRVERLCSVAEGLVPSDDDEDWSLFSPLAQNAAAAAAYALRSWLSGDPQEAVWAARQAFEAGDYLVQLGAATQTYVTDTRDEDPVSVVVSAMESALSVAGNGSAMDLRQLAETGGSRLHHLLPQE